MIADPHRATKVPTCRPLISLREPCRAFLDRVFLCPSGTRSHSSRWTVGRL